MWYKVKWLTFWISMVLWFGNFWGCVATGDEQNYKSTAPETPSRLERYDSSRSVPVDQPDGPVVFVAQDTTPETKAPATDVKPEAKPEEAKPADTAPVDNKPAETAPAANVETEPSLRGLDRSHWPKIKTRAERGETYHYPIYYKDYPADRPEPQVNFSDSQEMQLLAALSGTKDHGLIDGHHALQLISLPAKVGLDTILLPFRMFQTPPWQWVTTPPTPAAPAN